MDVDYFKTKLYQCGHTHTHTHSIVNTETLQDR